MKKAFSVVFLAIVSFTGCSSLTTMQTANVIAPGETESGVALLQNRVLPDGVQSVGADGNVSYYTMEFTYRRGVADKLDMGFKLYPLAAEIDAKYQFIKTGRFALSGNFGVAYTSLAQGSESNEKTNFVDFYPTVLITYHVGQNFSLTVAPKTIFAYYSDSNMRGLNVIPGVTLTAAIGGGAAGQGFKLMPELGYYSIVGGASFATLGLGMTF